MAAMLFRSDRPWLAEGAVIERLRRDPRIPLDPHILHAAFVETADGRAALRRIYAGYLDAAHDHGLNTVILTPTWRASAERCRAAGHTVPVQLNRNGVRLLQALRAEYGVDALRVRIGGLIGCAGDAYDPSEALTAEHARVYHTPQIEALAGAGVDFLFAATLPAFSEAQGLAQAMAASGLPYTLGFVLRPTGTLLDGRPLREAVARIDDAVNPSPIGYMVNCVHPEVYAEAIEREIAKGLPVDRLLGLQANTSKRSPEELDGAAELDATDPEPFADAMVAVGRRFGLRILGGCCGTDDAHIRALAARLQRQGS